ncbi:histidine kinase, partial [Aerococcus urinae]|uniref:histidine kinase n=2 Tax=Aerococcus TaxID=1375 RepID=UPI00254A6EE8
VRLDPNRARQLLIELSHYFRANLNGARNEKISISQELEHIQAYLSIIQARFPDRYQISKVIDPASLDLLIPPFVLQMLVENAIQHAFENKANKNDQA